MECLSQLKRWLDHVPASHKTDSFMNVFFLLEHQAYTGGARTRVVVRVRNLSRLTPKRPTSPVLLPQQRELLDKGSNPFRRASNRIEQKSCTLSRRNTLGGWFPLTSGSSSLLAESRDLVLF